MISLCQQVITNKEESFHRKSLASIITNTVNIMRMCYSRITSIKSKDTIAGPLIQQT